MPIPLVAVMESTTDVSPEFFGVRFSVDVDAREEGLGNVKIAEVHSKEDLQRLVEQYEQEKRLFKEATKEVVKRVINEIPDILEIGAAAYGTIQLTALILRAMRKIMEKRREVIKRGENPLIDVFYEQVETVTRHGETRGFVDVAEIVQEIVEETKNYRPRQHGVSPRTVGNFLENIGFWNVERSRYAPPLPPLPSVHLVQMPGIQVVQVGGGFFDLQFGGTRIVVSTWYQHSNVIIIGR